MPDRYGERPDPELGDDPDEQPVDLDKPHGPTPAELRALAVQACDLCDDEGYRGAIVCDHTDHRPANRHGIEQIRRQMGWN